MSLGKAADQPVIISGGGLAGLSLGVALMRRGVPVELHEQGRYPRHRVCGEFVCGVEAATLNFLGIERFFAPADRLRSSIWYWQGKRVWQRALPRAAYGLSRYGLDFALVEELRAGGARVREKSYFRPNRPEGIVLATGRSSGRGGFLGFKAHVTGLSLGADLELHLGSGGYVGLSPVEGGWVNVCGLFSPEFGLRAGRREALLAHCRATGLVSLADRLGGAVWSDESCQGIAGVICGPAPGQRGPPLVRIGDAWGVTPPFTGNGMSIALESAALAVGPLEKWSRGELPWSLTVAAVEKACRRTFARRLRVAGWLHPWLFRPGRQRILIPLAQSGFLPFNTVFRWSH